MSGAEVGLVLAIIPLVIAGLEYSDKVRNPIKAFLRKPEELKKFCHALGDQTTLLRLSTRELFGDIDTLSPQQIEALLDDDNDLDILWSDETLTAIVRDKLGSPSAYRSYMDNVERIKVAIESLIKTDKSLHLISAEKTSRATLDMLVYEQRKNAWSAQEVVERFRFSTRDAKRNKTLREIEACNDYLEKFMSRSREVTHATKSWKRRLADPLHQVRGYASTLHNKLSQVWRCPCQTPHKARLRLEKRKFTTSSLLEDLHFQILFSCEANNSGEGQVQWQWQEAEIRIPIQKTQIPQRSRVRFEVPSISPVHVLREPSNYTGLTEVDCICNTISTAQAQSCCLGFVLDEQHKLHGTYQRVQRSTTWDLVSPDFISLGNLLEKQFPFGVPTKYHDAYRVSKKERLVLAVNLASSLLQLHATPWLSERWTKSDIVFLPPDKNSTENPVSHSSRLFNADEPYVSQTFMSCHLPTADEQAEDTPAPPVHGNLNLLALGIILLELYFGQSIESKRQPEDLSNGQANGSTDLNVARRWLLDSYQRDMSNRYWMATNHCIHCFFDPMPKSTDLHDEDFRESVYQKIVLPLEEELQQWEGNIY